MRVCTDGTAGPALVQTVDFFTPIVDDPYQSTAQMAAANALSDVYAMGGRPVTALAIAGFPDGGLDEATIRAIFRGGFDKLREAGAVLLGGHTVRDREIKFGYAITGAVEPDRLLSNAGARPGDRLFLTKPIGTGIVGTAIKFERAPDDLVQQAVASMCQLNRAAAEAIEPSAASDVHACTDVTGFGLAGHAIEMAEASGVTLEIRGRADPGLRRPDGARGAEPLGWPGVEPGAFRGTDPLRWSRRSAAGGLAVRPADLGWTPGGRGGGSHDGNGRAVPAGRRVGRGNRSDRGIQGRRRPSGGPRTELTSLLTGPRARARRAPPRPPVRPPPPHP